MRTKIKDIIRGKIFIMLLSIIILYMVWWYIMSETNADRVLRLSKEIEIAKSNNISYATNQLTKLRTELDELEWQVSKKRNDMYIYSECIRLNKLKDIPTNCQDVTIDLSSDLWWKVNESWMSQWYRQLIWDTAKARAEYLLDWFAHARWTIEIWIELWMKYHINPYLAISIAKADSSLGNSLKSKNNIGNVWNNDRWDTVDYGTKSAGIEAIFKVLNNKYLWWIYTIGYLSCWGKKALWIKDCTQNWEKVYATSKENWNINVINTLRMIYRDGSIDENYKFRTK